MQFFDCNCEIGLHIQPPFAPATNPQALRTEMDRTGVARALVRYAAQAEDSPATGNPEAVEALAPFANLLPTWSILPPQTRELGTVPEFVAAMAAADVRALWAAPSKHRFLLNAETFGDLFDEMIARGIPLFVQLSEACGGLDGWGMCTDLLRQVPNLTLVLVGHGPWGHDRYFRPLIERYPNFHVDTARYELDGGIADFCRTYGPERMLFGTAFPFTPMGGPLLTLLHADIPDEDRALIAGGNLERILKGVRF
jgi:predicted TIM-barrel fold metal-dependent hydrolase